MSLGFEELPDGARLQELRGFLLDDFEVLIQFERLGIARLQQLLEVAFEPQVTTINHEGIHVGPQLLQVGDIAHVAVEIGNGGNRDVGANTCGAGASGVLHGRLIGLRHRFDCQINVFGQRGVAACRVHQFVHHRQAGHGVFGVERGAAVGRADARVGEAFGERGSAYQQRHVHAVFFEIGRRRHHLMRALDQQS